MTSANLEPTNLLEIRERIVASETVLCGSQGQIDTNAPDGCILAVIDAVLARSTDQTVVAPSADEDVIPAAANEEIVAAPTVENVRIVIASDPV